MFGTGPGSGAGGGMNGFSTAPQVRRKPPSKNKIDSFLRLGGNVHPTTNKRNGNTNSTTARIYNNSSNNNDQNSTSSIASSAKTSSLLTRSNSKTNKQQASLSKPNQATNKGTIGSEGNSYSEGLAKQQKSSKTSNSSLLRQSSPHNTNHHQQQRNNSSSGGGSLLFRRNSGGPKDVEVVKNNDNLEAWTAKRVQRNQIYALNELMTKMEHEDFLYFCKQNNISLATNP